MKALFAVTVFTAALALGPVAAIAQDRDGDAVIIPIAEPHTYR